MPEDTKPTGMLDHALAWAKRGFRVFPVTINDKTPAMKGWQSAASSNPDEIKKLWGSKPYNVGVLAENLIVVDIDEKSGKHGLRDWYMIDGDRPPSLTVKTPTGGRHIYYANSEATTQKRLTSSIDIRAAGLGFVIAPGSVTKDGEYTLLKDAPVAPAPQWLADHCWGGREPVKLEAQIELDTPSSIAMAEALVSSLPEVEAGDRDNAAFQAACDLKDLGISPETCLDMLVGWNAEKVFPPLSEETLGVKVDSAYKNGLNTPGCFSMEAEFGDIQLPVEDLPLPASLMWAGDKGIKINNQWLMWDRLPRTGTGLLIGPSGCGKTFLSLDLAKKLANGEDFMGEHGDEKVGTVILAAEGAGGLKLRIKHLSDKTIPVAAFPIKLMRDKENIKAISKALQEAQEHMRSAFGVRLGLVILDTITASGIFESENDSADISNGLAALNNLSKAFDCFVLSTHHPPKTGTGARGSSALHSGVDVTIEVFNEEYGHIVQCTKNRDGKEGWWGSYTLFEDDAEIDTSRNRMLTTMRVIYGEAKRGEARAELEPMIETQETVRQVLYELPEASKEELEARLKDVVSKGKGQSEQALLSCLNWILAKEVI